jgi:type IV fimbrial biogenesis protein FimT
MSDYEKSSGFTLPEMLITLGMVAIVLSLAVPSISNMIKDNQLVAHLNNVVTDIHFARSEAVKRDVRVIMCRSNSTGAPVPTCGGTSYDWSTGYIIFADNGQYANNVYNSGTDTLLRVVQPSKSTVNMRTSGNWNNNLEFNSDGSTNESGIAIMSFCDGRGTEYGKQIQVNANGIPKLVASNINDCTPDS